MNERELRLLNDKVEAWETIVRVNPNHPFYSYNQECAAALRKLLDHYEAMVNPPSGWVIIESDGRYLTLRDQNSDEAGDKEISLDTQTGSVEMYPNGES